MQHSQKNIIARASNNKTDQNNMSKQIQRANKLAKQSQLTVKTISTTIAKRYTNNPWAIHTSA